MRAADDWCDTAGLSSPAGQFAERPDFRGYAGTVIAMGTMHGKERQVGPPFAEVLGARVVAPGGIDTDRFGTFTGDVSRTLAPLAAATEKARLAMQVAGVPLGLASEASYETWLGVLARHEEVMVFIDDTRGILVVEAVAVPAAPGAPQLVDVAEHAVEAARRFGFPGQGAAVKAVVDGRPDIFGKGITDATTLVGIVDAALAVADSGQAWVEPDLRAQHNPSRRNVLIALAGRLARRLVTACPRCQCPGYGVVGVCDGLPCLACGCSTTLIAADVYGCPSCEHRSTVWHATPGAEARFCPRCNP